MVLRGRASCVSFFIFCLNPSVDAAAPAAAGGLPVHTPILGLWRSIVTVSLVDIDHEVSVLLFESCSLFIWRFVAVY